YCGMGNLAFPLAAAGMKVTGVEHSRFAVEDADKNAARLNLPAEFLPGDAIHAARRMTKEKRAFDTVLLDPPRNGAKGIGQYLKLLAKERVVYVSCNPPSLARDAKDICENGFALVSAQPLDMFPNTFHVETLALFERR
ncbi:MAG: class I SAM-dependent RNA methyltransferase, partial [Candidatus Nitrosotenuis sp.]